MSSEPVTWETLADDWPYTTILIALVVVVAFVLQLVLAPAACADATYPALCSELVLLRHSTWLGVLVMPFLHGTWFHLGSNLLALLLFGAGTEALYGRRLLLWLFAAAGYLSTEIQLVQKLATDQTPVTVGISGAVFALGAFLGVVLCPTSRSGLQALVNELRGPEVSLRPPLLVLGLSSMVYAVVTHVNVLPIDPRTATLSHLVGAAFGAGTGVYIQVAGSELSFPSFRLTGRS